MVIDTSVDLEPQSHELSLPNEERTLQTFADIKLHGTSQPSDAVGRLTVTDRRLIWKKDAAGDDEASWTAPFLSVNLHALSTDASGGHGPCVYAQIGDEGQEVRLIPVVDSVDEELRKIYDVMCEAAALNVESDSDGEGGAFGMMPAGIGEYEGPAGSGAGEPVAVEGAAEMLARLDGMLQVPEGIVGSAGGEADVENAGEEDVENAGVGGDANVEKG